MRRLLAPLVILWLLSSSGSSQTDAAFVQRVENTTPQALDQIIRELPATTNLVTALLTRADELFQAADYEKALRLNEAAAAVAVRADQREAVAKAYRAEGLCYRRLGRQEQSLQSNLEGLKYSEPAGAKAVSAQLYRGVGLAHRALGNNQAAIEAYQKSIAFCEEARDQECMLLGITNLGSVYSLTGDFRRAAEVLHAGLQQAIQSDSVVQLGMLNNLAVVYGSQGDSETAREYFERALALGRAKNSNADVALALANLVPIYGLTNPDLGRRTAEEGLRLARENNQARVAAGLEGQLAVIDSSLGHYRDALRHRQASLNGFEAVGQRGMASGELAEIAELYVNLGDDAAALEWAAKAETEARATGTPWALWTSLEVRGRACRHLGRRDEAREAFAQEIALHEATRGSVAGGEAQRSGFMETKTGPLYALMEMAIEEQQTAAALSNLEQARARLLVEVLENGRADLNRRMTDAERREELRLTTAADASMADAVRGDKAARAKWDAARRNLSTFRTSLYTSHPELQLRRGEASPFRLGDAANLVPDSHTALVEFALSGGRIFAFVLDRGTGGDPELTVSSTAWDRATETELAAFRRSLAGRQPDYRQHAAALYHRIFGPIAARLRGKTMVGIVPDGALWGVPLQALVQPNGRHFLEDHAVFYAPSLTALREILRRTARVPPQPATVLAFGAPTPEKFAGALPPLPESGREAAQVAAVYSRSTAYTGMAARKRLWMKEAPDRPVLHLATHASLNGNNPLYSYMVLSDGVIEAREILDLDLHAQLVVLSGCDTGLGSVRSGEGLIGMGWAFLVAGSQAAVVSQWQVDSRSTAGLMVAMHRSYHAGGLPVARALQHAALQTMKTPGFRHPYYWAGFVVLGAGI